MKATLVHAKKIANELNIDTKIVPLSIIKYGLNVELEHGRKLGKITNVTHDNMHLTGKIVLAHLLESPDYYQRLQKMEAAADKYWEKHEKPSIIKSKVVKRTVKKSTSKKKKTSKK